MFPVLEMKWPGNIPLRAFMLCVEVWANTRWFHSPVLTVATKLYTQTSLCVQ
jgi:hypothetical protein